MRLILAGIAMLLTASAVAEMVELECKIDDATHHYIIDLETDEVTYSEGGQFSNVSISPVAVGFSAYYESDDSKWLMQRNVIRREDLELAQSMYGLDEGKIKSRRVGHGLLSWNFKVGKINPWSDDVRPDDWELMIESKGACEIVERKRAF